jgi:thiosulfate/3-mercaptopyruvate sulfurtransferase
VTEPLPLLIEPAVLESKLGTPGLLVVDLSRPQIHAQAHLPGAVPVDYASINAAVPPAMGLVPDAAQLSATLSAIGLTADTHVLAYDADGNTRAARFLWTLEVIGHTRYSLLNGGLIAWQQEHRRLTSVPTAVVAGRYQATTLSERIADKQWILDHLVDRNTVVLDARTPEEYSGELVRAQRGGHIPRAVNFDYANAIDRANGLRLKPLGEIEHALGEIGVTPDKEVVVYCQTHHRSAHTWFVLKQLGFGKLRGYPGSWSEWGNDPALPVER